MLASKFASLFFIYYLLNVDFVSSASGPCFAQNNCQCIFPSGAIIDLSKFPLRASTVSVPKSSLKVTYLPCDNLPVVIPPFYNITNPCEEGVSVCIFNNTAIHDGGHKEDLLFSSTFQEDNVTATFTKNKWKTVINIDCNKDAGTDNSLSFSELDTTPTLSIIKLNLRSNNVCIGFNAASGYGFFSSLFMVIVLGFTIYFVGGAILLKFLRGADGLEMIPNYEFWQNFPQLCKNWFNKLRGQERPETYENI